MLEDLKTDISRLMALYEKEKQKVGSLALRLAEEEERTRKYKEEIRKCREQITDLNLQIDNLRLGAAFADSGEGKEGKSLDRLIREIDECIKLLES